MSLTHLAVEVLEERQARVARARGADLEGRLSERPRRGGQLRRGRFRACLCRRRCVGGLSRGERVGKGGEEDLSSQKR